MTFDFEFSLFAAEAGARRVIGIDRAAIVDKAAQIVKANNKQDVITLVKGRVEELAELPEPKVCRLLDFHSWGFKLVRFEYLPNHSNPLFKARLDCGTQNVSLFR